MPHICRSEIGYRGGKLNSGQSIFKSEGLKETAFSTVYQGDLQMVDSSSIRVHQHAAEY